MSMNRTIISGRLVRDPELRVTTTGKNIVEISVAVKKRFKPNDGSVDSDFFRVQAWEKTADYISNYAIKGSWISVDGYLTMYKYTDKAGQSREQVQIVAERVHVMSKDRNDGNDQTGTLADAVKNSDQYNPTTSAALEEYDPFADE